MTYIPDDVAGTLAGIRTVGVITGAGISAESGIPTYRGKGGIYDDPAAGDRTVEALSGPTLLADPDRTWRTIADLARRARAARPNPGHHALAEIERKVDRFILLTQNVDGLHQQAGSRNVIDIHGDVFATICTACHEHGRLEQLEDLERAPRCGGCGGLLRPGVVLFGEMLSPAKIHHLMLEFYTRAPELVIIAGTSALFPYIVEPVMHARDQGRLTLEINLEQTAVSELVDHSLRGSAATLLPLIAAAIGARDER